MVWRRVLGGSTRRVGGRWWYEEGTWRKEKVVGGGMEEGR